MACAVTLISPVLSSLFQYLLDHWVSQQCLSSFCPCTKTSPLCVCVSGGVLHTTSGVSLIHPLPFFRAVVGSQQHRAQGTVFSRISPGHPPHTHTSAHTQHPHGNGTCVTNDEATQLHKSVTAGEVPGPIRVHCRRCVFCGFARCAVTQLHGGSVPQTVVNTLRILQVPLLPHLLATTDPVPVPWVAVPRSRRVRGLQGLCDQVGGGQVLGLCRLSTRVASRASPRPKAITAACSASS